MSIGRLNPLPSAAPTPRSRRLTAPKLLAWGAFGVLLYVAHAAFIPIALALLLSLVLSGPVEALHKHRVARSLSAAFILVLALAVMVVVVNLMWSSAQGWMARAPQTLATVKQRIRPVAQFMAKADELRKNVGNLSSTSRPGAAAAAAGGAAGPAAGVGANAPVQILDATGVALTASLTFVIVTLFLLAGGPPMLARMTAAFADDLNASHVLDIIEKVRAEVGRFYVTTALINVAMGCAVAGAMAALGMPTPYLWGVLAAILNFIPYAGSATTLTVISLVAVVSFDTLGPVLAVAGSYVGIALIEGQVVQPLLIGRRLQVNPLLIFLALWFGGLFWGVAGIILATPVLVAIKVIAKNANGGNALVEFLGPNNQSPHRDDNLKRFAPARLQV